MTIDYKIVVGKSLSNAEKESVNQIIRQTFEETDTIYNKWNPNSELSKLNRLPAGKIVPISSKLEKLLLLTHEVYLLSEKRFDPTIETLQSLWKKHLETGKIPSETAILNILPSVGWEKVHLNNGQFYKDHDLLTLDLGGIAKGFCIDRMVEELNKAGYVDVFVEWGGEIRASGFHPDGRTWNVFISRLGNTDPAEAITTFSLCDAAIATSGDYLQNWTIELSNEEGKIEKTTFFHIIDPLSYYPLKIENNSIASASVLAPSCALADGLATAAMLFPTLTEAHDWAVKLKNDNPNLSFWFIQR